MPNGEHQIIGPDQSQIFDAGVIFLSLRHQCENPEPRSACWMDLPPKLIRYFSKIYSFWLHVSAATNQAARYDPKQVVECTSISMRAVLAHSPIVEFEGHSLEPADLTIRLEGRQLEELDLSVPVSEQTTTPLNHG